MKNKKIQFLVKAAISIGLITWIIFLIDWQQVWTYVQKVHVWQLGIYVCIYMLGVVISSWKWRFIALHKKINLPFLDFFKLYYSATFINNFMPSFIGGDTFKAYQIGKKDKKYYESASTVVVDRMTGLWAVMILSVIFALLNISTIFQHMPLFIINSIFLVITLFSFFIFRPRKLKIYKACIHMIERLFGVNSNSPKDPKTLKVKSISSAVIRKANKAICRTLEEMERYGDNSILLKTLLFSFLFSFVGLALANYILFLSLGVVIPIFDFLSIIFLISIVASIPISINNIGVKEWAYIFFFGLFGVELSLAVTVVILSRVVQMLMSFIALPLYWQYRKNSRET